MLLYFFLWQSLFDMKMSHFFSQWRFELPSLITTSQRHKPIANREKTGVICFCRFVLQKVFVTGFYNIFVVFLNPPCQETPKKRQEEKKKIGRWWVVGMGFRKFMGGPSEVPAAHWVFFGFLPAICLV
jgi:hypothetical protein